MLSYIIAMVVMQMVVVKSVSCISGSRHTSGAVDEYIYYPGKALPIAAAVQTSCRLCNDGYAITATEHIDPTTPYHEVRVDRWYAYPDAPTCVGSADASDTYWTACPFHWATPIDCTATPSLKAYSAGYPTSYNIDAKIGSSCSNLVEEGTFLAGTCFDDIGIATCTDSPFVFKIISHPGYPGCTAPAPQQVVTSSDTTSPTTCLQGGGTSYTAPSFGSNGYDYINMENCNAPFQSPVPSNVIAKKTGIPLLGITVLAVLMIFA